MAGFPDELYSEEATVVLSLLPKSKNSPKLAEALRPLAGTIDARMKIDREEVGAFMACAVEHFTADQASDFFAQVVEMKRNHEREVHRNAWAQKAYSDFIEETGKEPSKPQLKGFMQTRK
ncbi:MAG: hypothetical protein EOP84_05180, partial [Verrucomicrobiaceae bacterium]